MAADGPGGPAVGAVGAAVRGPRCGPHAAGRRRGSCWGGSSAGGADARARARARAPPPARSGWVELGGRQAARRARSAAEAASESSPGAHLVRLGCCQLGLGLGLG